MPCTNYVLVVVVVAVRCTLDSLILFFVCIQGHTAWFVFRFVVVCKTQNRLIGRMDCS